MAILPDADRARVCAGLQRYTDFGSAPNTLKADLRAAVNAADVWIDGNTAAFTTALPQPFRNNSTAMQKLLLFIAVLLMRTNPDLLRRIVGEID